MYRKVLVGTDGCTAGAKAAAAPATEGDSDLLVLGNAISHRRPRSLLIVNTT